MTEYEINKFVIESGKDIPVPPILGRRPKYPFAEMEVGDTFFAKAQPAWRLSSAATRWAKKLNRKFTVRKEQWGTRVWRVK